MSLPLNQIILGDAIEQMKALPDNSINALISDPPYGIGLAAWDKAIDVSEFTQQVKRVCTGFYGFFGQMPTLIDWMVEAKANRMHFCEHISWVKRISAPSSRLQRGHEEILIYSTGKQRKFHQVKGRYEDVKLPGVLVDVVTLEGIDRYVKDLRIKAAGKIPMHNRTKGNRQAEFSRLASYPAGDCSPEFANYTNVWSFVPPTQSQRNLKTKAFRHPTEKPLEVMKRLVEMLTPDGGIVLDPFSGSGTTAIACIETGRNFIGIEKDPTYHALSLQRIATSEGTSQIELSIRLSGSGSHTPTLNP